MNQNHIAMNQLYTAETIAAIATAPGRGGVGIVRLSGKGLLPLAQQLCAGQPPKPRYAHYRDFLTADGQVIDSGLLLYFPAPNSFTGEDVLELQGHGGPVVLHMLLTRCIELGARLAEPGEFSKRAFLNGRIDLTQAESIADLIDANSERAAKSALRSLSGAFSSQIRQLVDELINLRMLVEATLDFPEEDIDFLQAADASGKLDAIRRLLGQILSNAQQGAILREGLRVVLIGAPNVGKSSLMNALAGDEVAIVTDVAGTTRDTLREEIVIDGVPLHIIDTAGLRDTDDQVEKIGIARTWSALEQADLALVLTDQRQHVDATVQAVLDRLPEQLPRLFIHNKIDLSHEPAGADDNGRQMLIRLSAKTGDGIDLLRRELLRQVGWLGNEEGLFLARGRHLAALREAQLYLDEANVDYQQSELMAESLRQAQQALGRITGEFAADDLLGEIFSRFCIGK